jgi:hypothetical protein
MNLDHDLRQALSRKTPPAGFDHRVLQRVRAGDSSQRPDRPSSWRRYLVPVAASVLLIGGSYALRQWDQRQADQERAAAERATVQVAVALRIASDKLSEVQTKVQEFNQHDYPTQH